MVASCWVVINARRLGRSASKSAEWAEREFTFPLEVLEGADRILQVSKDFPLYLLLYAMPYQKKAGTGKAG